MWGRIYQDFKNCCSGLLTSPRIHPQSHFCVTFLLNLRLLQENREGHWTWFFSVFSRIRTLSARCLSVLASSLHGVDRLGRFMGQSIAYGLRNLTKEGIFLGQSRSWWEGSEVQFPLYFVWKLDFGGIEEG